MNPLSKATRGVIRRNTSKNALILAMVGVLYFTEVLEFIPPTETEGGRVRARKSIVRGETPWEEQLLSRQERIKREDEEIMIIIKAFLDVID